MATATGIASIAGCTRVKCAIDGNYDRLELSKVPTDIAESPESIVVRYSELNSDAQQAVRKAVSKGSYRECHEFDTGQSGIEAFRDHIAGRWEQVDDGNAPKGERTYLKRDGVYYGIEVTILDVEGIDSTA